MNKRPKKLPLINLILFIITIITTCIAGVLWAGKDFTDLTNIWLGATYSVLILTFLSAHEFGHYIAARIHSVDSTLPFYIPFPPSPYFPSFGTFGAVIKTRSPIQSKRALFDIGAAGPIAGFVVCLAFLIYGFQTLPPKEFIYSIHPEYLTKFGGEVPAGDLNFGDTILFWLLAKLFANPGGWMPPMSEVYHYPFLNVGWFGLFVTSLNLLPMGQLDGGHICYSMFGARQARLARYIWWIIVIIGFGSILGLIHDELQFDNPNGLYLFFQDNLLPFLKWLKNIMPWYFRCWSGWLFWAIITRWVVKLRHPEVGIDEEISNGRKILGWISLLIFILSFSYNGIYLIE